MSWRAWTIPEMGGLAYPDQQLVRSELDYDSEDNAPISSSSVSARPG